MSFPHTEGTERVLTPAAVAFVDDLVRRFGSHIDDLLRRRREAQARRDAGERLDFLRDTADLRAGDWTIAPTPADLQDRRVEITGPVDHKMIINALNSGASVFMADFEDANSPTWANTIGGQANLIDAVRRTITFESDAGKRYSLDARTAVLFVRPRGFHLPERHWLVEGKPAPGMLVDFGLYFFHNVDALRRAGTGPYFYLPKMESHREARLWNDIFVHAQEALDVPRGTIKATVLIETLPAAFEMDEILFELKDHSAGLNCGRWDYIFSAIKTRQTDPGFVLPDRGQVTMEAPFLQAYVRLLIKTCHRRRAHAMGGMAAQVPIKNDPVANEEALEKVRLDKLREVKAGHDGTWVAHPGLVPIAKKVFDEGMPTPNQISIKREPVHITPKDLLTPADGTITEAGLRWNIDVGLQYLEAWLRGVGCVPIYNLMEDAATAEICRAQVWQWVKWGAKLDDGRPVTAAMVNGVVDDLLAKRGATSGEFAKASQIFRQMMTSADFSDFLTLPAYSFID